jgi:hypothetical protein
MKKIYFVCSIAGGRDYAFVYKDVVEVIKKCDVEVIGELFADPNLEPDLGTDPTSTPRKVWKRDTSWLSTADAVIAEATQPSLGVGYQIARAEALKKPLLVLFYKKSVERFSWMISGSPKIKTVEYTEYAEAKKAIKEFIAKLG